MKLRIVSLLCLFLAIACSTDEVEVTEVVIQENISLNQRIVNQMNADGYTAVLTDDDKIVTIGFKNTKGFILKLNQIFDILSEPHQKLEFNEIENQTRDFQCENVGSYTSDDGVRCSRYVCSGTGEEIAALSMGSVGEVHYVYYTSCYSN